jgi:hypothetical protein
VTAASGWRRSRAIVIVVLVAAVLTGCRSPGEFSDRCPGTRDVAEIIGVEVASGVEIEGKGLGATGFVSEGCRYATSPVLERPEGTISIKWLMSDHNDLFDRRTAPRAAEARERPFEPIEGLGFEARLDGEELAVRALEAIVFVEVSPGLRSTVDVVPAATEVFKAIDPTTFSVARPADCDAWARPVTGVLGPLGRSIPPAPKDEDKTVATVALSAQGCRFDLASGSVASVLLADPARWPAWVGAKERSAGRTRYVEREVAGRRAVQLVNTLVVAAGSKVLEVDTQDVAGTDAEMDRIREALALLVLD